MSFNEIFPNHPKGWRSLTLGELAKESGGSIQTGPFGSQLHASDYVECGIPSIMPKNISVDGVLKDEIAQIKPEDAERLEKYKVRLGDVVYSRRGDVEKCCLITEKEDGWLCGTGCLRVRISAENLLQQYIHAYLCHPAVRNWVVRHAIGATMPNLNTSILSALPVLIPSTKEMQRIVEIWSAVSKKITLNTQINQTLEQMAQALFKSWFVDFDPVIDNALEAGNPIPEPLAERAERRQAMWAAGSEKAPARLPAETRRLFPDRFEENEVLGWVPVGWNIFQAKEIADVTIGKTPPRKQSDWFSKERNNNFVWVSIRDIGKSGAFIFNSDEYLTPEAVDKFRVKVVPVGSVALSFKLTVGRVSIVAESMTTNEAIAHFSSYKQGVEKEYLYCYLKSFDFGSLGNTSSIANAVNSKIIKSMPILTPGRNLIEKFCFIVRPWFEMLLNNYRENISFSLSRDTLLPKLLSGELQLPEAEAAVDTALEIEPA